MAENNNKRITGMLLSKGRRAQYIKVFAVLAACIAVAVGFALRYNGVAMTHEERTLACPVAERIAEAKANGETPPAVAHVHDESCYDADGNLVCPLEEKVLHTHDESCYDADGNLVCPLEEKVLHTHDDSCYTTERRLVCGLEEGADHVHTDACYQTERKLTCGKEEIVEEHVHGPGCFETVTVSDDADEDADTSANDAEADEGDDAAAKVDDNNAEGDKADDKTKDAEADKADDKAAVTDKDADKANAAKDDNADDKAAAADKADDKAKDAEADKTDDNAAATDKADDKTKDSDKDADKAAATDKAEDKTKDSDKAKDSENLPAQSFEQPVTNAKGEEVLRVKVEAPAGAFPKGTTMEVKSVKSSEVSEVVSEAMADAGNKRDVDSMEAVDIVFRDEKGKEIEPLLPITVSMTSDKIADKATNPVLVHVDDKGKGEVVDQLNDKQAAERKVETGENTLAFDADAFSVYVIAYTVDFHWEVDGEKYDFSIPGGGFVSFTDLIEVLGIAEGTNSEGNTVNSEEKAGEDALTLSGIKISDSTKKFVADVESVEFSSPDLVWVGKVESDTKVGDLKNANGLEVQYSADLSKDQIEQINAQTVKSGDWVLISKLPFLSDESLTVTMKDGEVFTIKVTDAQISKKVLTADGKTYEITVTYDENAKIPKDSELRVEEITRDDERFAKYCDKTQQKLNGDDVASETEATKANSIEGTTTDSTQNKDLQNVETQAENEYIRVFDIQILNGDKKIEPKAEVRVDIKLLDAPEEERMSPKVVHFAKDGPEVMDVTAPEADSKEAGLSFMTDEFSVYSVTYTVDFAFNIDGREYAFSLEGGDSTSFKEIIERFEIMDKDKADTFIRNIKKVEFTNPDYLWNGKITKGAFAGELKEQYNLDVTYASDIKPGNIMAMDNHFYSAPDWVLIALKPFTSEEKLTITMKSGEVFTIKVTDAQSDAVHNSDGTVQTIPNPQGTTIELFNYYVSSDTKTTAGRDQWPGHVHDNNDRYKFNWYSLDGTYVASWEEGWGWGHDDNWRNNNLLGNGNNIGINKDHVFKFSPANAGTVIDGTTGKKTNDGGPGLNSWTKDADPKHGIVEGTLSNGYPILTTNSTLGTNGESLAYLFDKTTQEGKDSYGAVDHLLYVDPDGYYTYDSRDFKAEYQSDGTFKVSDQPNTDNTELKGFWPFGDEVFWVGMHMNTQFSMPANGQVLNPKGEMKDMQFEFSGDDDTWLYIDGVLVGDGGGIHNRTEIDVNFANGTVIVTGKKDTVHTGTFEETKYLDDIFKTAGRYNDADWEDIGEGGNGHKRLKTGTYHTFDMFYLERGGGESNLYIHYNLVSTEDFTGHKAYEGFAEDERMERDQFRFEMIGLDGQYQSEWNEETHSATVTKLNDTGHAIMPVQGSESGAGTLTDPKKQYNDKAWTDSNGKTLGGYILTTGVTENGDIRFGSANISAEEMLACDQGHPSLYRYIIREKVPDDAVNAEGVSWAEASNEQKSAGGFVKDQVQYDGTIYYMTARVTSWQQTGADGNEYTAYGLSKTYYTDDSFTKVKNDVTFVDFRNHYAPDSGKVEFTKVDGSNNPLSGAEFTLYEDEECSKTAKNLVGEEQVVESGTDGKVTFDNMAAPRTYFMKETKAPTGYELSDTTYEVNIESSKHENKVSSIIRHGDETKTPVTRIVNTKSGELTVVKEWIDANGNEVSGGNRTAHVKLQRYHYLDNGISNHKVHFKISIQNRSDLVYEYIANSVGGSTITADWWDTNQDIKSLTVRDQKGSSLSYKQDSYWDDINKKNRKVTVSNIPDKSDVYISVQYDKDWLFNSEHTPWMKNISVVGSSEHTTQIEEDSVFNSRTDNDVIKTLASPNWAYTWKIGNGPGFDMPITDGANPYIYYVVEVKDDGNGGWIEVPVGGELQDGVTLQRIVYSPEKIENVGIQTGAIVVTNEAPPLKTINVGIKKTDNAEKSTNYLSGAVFKLTYRSNSSEAFVNVSNESVVELDSDSQFTVPASGITLTGLMDGQYQLQEISPPDGYVITNSHPVTFTVSGGTITSTEGTITDVRYTAGTSSTDPEFIIPNVPGEVLPSTGGSGTRCFTIIGSIVTLLAGGLLFMRRYRTSM